MKVISKGAIPEERIHRATCDYCTTVVEFMQKEGEVTTNQRDGSFVSVKCPICKRLISKII